MSLILEDESKRRQLNGITHPRIFRRMLWEIASYAAKGHNYAVLDVPLLFESSAKLIKWFHKIIVVTCERDLQMQRLMEAREMTERNSGLLIDAQMDLEQKANRADYVVENSGNLQDLKTQVCKKHGSRVKASWGLPPWPCAMQIDFQNCNVFRLWTFILKLASQSFTGRSA
jgi:dephospho-CoA kinase